MENRRFNILLIEDNLADARLIHELVSEVRSSNLDFEFAESLSQGLSRLDSPGIDAVLLDLYLPNSQGIETFFQVRSHAGNIPILLLTGLSDEDLAIRAVREGAQDYLVKGQVNGNLLVRAVNYAIERQRLLAQLEEARQEAQRLTLIDDLTGSTTVEVFMLSVNNNGDFQAGKSRYLFSSIVISTILNESMILLAIKLATKR